ncbi:MAG: Holliday junction resolvase RecU [Alicyclobacillus herbarius]|nr:Holliday junction resolvase RecU [Alicyclobacillus herbarius]
MYGNRGAALESLINQTNEVYRARGWAVVTKRPTPVAIVRTKGTHTKSSICGRVWIKVPSYSPSWSLQGTTSDCMCQGRSS